MPSHLNGIAATMVAALSVGAVAVGDTATITGYPPSSTEQLGQFGATLQYTLDGSGNGILTIELLNASPADNGGFITGFVFNVESADPNAIIILQPGADYPFVPCAGKAPPFGNNFDAGLALGGSWTGGGDPTMGIPAGMSGTFVFTVIASDAALLKASSFGAGPYAADFAVRFRAFNDGGSDKVPGYPICPCDLNYDGVISYGDVQIVLNEWGWNPGSIADWDHDGDVDAYDLALVLKCWEICQIWGGSGGSG